MIATEPATDSGSGSGTALIDGVDVDAIATAVRECAAVDDLYSGRVGAVATYLPGRRVSGVRVADDSLTVQVRSRWGIAAADVRAQIVDALTLLAAGRRIDVVIADITDAPQTPPAALPAVPPAALVAAGTLPLEVSAAEPDVDFGPALDAVFDPERPDGYR